MRGWRLAGEIATARRQWDDAEAALRQALTVAQGIGNPTQLWRTHFALGQFHDALGKREAAGEAYIAARDVIEHVKRRLQIPALRASLDAAPFIQQLYELSRNQG